MKLENRLNKIAAIIPKLRLYNKHFFIGFCTLVLELKAVLTVTILVAARFIPRSSYSNTKHINRHN